MGNETHNPLDRRSPSATDAHAQTDQLTSPALPELQLRVVREARRETWFVVNAGTEALATLPLPLGEGRSVRRCHVNGEPAEFVSAGDVLTVTPQRTLRAGAGTIVVVNFR